MLKYDFKYPLDAPERTLEHAKIIKQKTFLRKLYTEWYFSFQKEIKTLPKGKILELGSGGGFSKEIIPDMICTDVIELPTNDITFSALEIPFENNSIAAVFMIDTFHHIPDSRKFLEELRRVLVTGGMLFMIEPANSWFGRLIYQNFHHEPFNPKGGWQIPSTGPLSGANGALPWIVFERDKAELKENFPELAVKKIKYHTPFTYLLSGGLTMKQFLPDFTYPIVRFFDEFFSGFVPHISMFVTVKVIVEK